MKYNYKRVTNRYDINKLCEFCKISLVNLSCSGKVNAMFTTKTGKYFCHDCIEILELIDPEFGLGLEGCGVVHEI